MECSLLNTMRGVLWQRLLVVRGCFETFAYGNILRMNTPPKRLSGPSSFSGNGMSTKNRKLSSFSSFLAPLWADKCLWVKISFLFSHWRGITWQSWISPSWLSHGRERSLACEMDAFIMGLEPLGMDGGAISTLNSRVSEFFAGSIRTTSSPWWVEKWLYFFSGVTCTRICCPSMTWSAACTDVAWLVWSCSSFCLVNLVQPSRVSCVLWQIWVLCGTAVLSGEDPGGGGNKKLPMFLSVCLCEWHRSRVQFWILVSSSLGSCADMNRSVWLFKGTPFSWFWLSLESLFIELVVWESHGRLADFMDLICKGWKVNGFFFLWNVGEGCMLESRNEEHSYSTFL